MTVGAGHAVAETPLHSSVHVPFSTQMTRIARWHARTLAASIAMLTAVTALPVQAQAPTVVIRGALVMDGVRNPIRHGTVRLMSPQRMLNDAQTDSVGRFTMTTLRPTSRVTLSVRALGYRSLTLELPGIATSDTIDVGSVSMGLFSGYPTPAVLYPRLTSAGFGLSNGALGVEHASFNSRPIGLGVGIGVAGVGGRVYRDKRIPGTRFVEIRTAAEFVYAPWRWGPFTASGGVGATLGVHRDGPQAFEVAAGYAWLRDGTWWGRRALPTVRVTLSRPGWSPY